MGITVLYLYCCVWLHLTSYGNCAGITVLDLEEG